MGAQTNAARIKGETWRLDASQKSILHIADQVESKCTQQWKTCETHAATLIRIQDPGKGQPI
eukprot:6187155-Pleurochrysis_carterae.AAC.1